MFRHEGPSRSTRKNAVLAAHLACVAGAFIASAILGSRMFATAAAYGVGLLLEAGAISGASLVLHSSHWAMLVPALAVFGASACACLTSRAPSA